MNFCWLKNVNPIDIYRQLKVVYSDKTVDRTTFNRWAIKFRGMDVDKAIIVDALRNGRLIHATDKNHRAQGDKVI